MAMAVDPDRQHQLAGGVDIPLARAEAAAEGDDNPVLDADITFRRIGGGRHRAVADHQIVVAHVSLAIKVSRRMTRQTACPRSRQDAAAEPGSSQCCHITPCSLDRLSAVRYTRNSAGSWSAPPDLSGETRWQQSHDRFRHAIARRFSKPPCPRPDPLVSSRLRPTAISVGSGWCLFRYWP